MEYAVYCNRLWLTCSPERGLLNLVRMRFPRCGSFPVCIAIPTTGLTSVGWEPNISATQGLVRS